MRKLRAWFMRLLGLFTQGRRDNDLAAEFDSHLQMHVEDNLRAGMSAEEARRKAVITLGGEPARESYRDQAGVPVLEHFVQDVRFGVRMLRKSPGFTLVAVLTLALGIGANTAIFSVANPVLFRPLPFRDPSKLVTVLESKASQHLEWLFVTQISYVEWTRRQTAFESMAAYHGCGYRMPGDGEPHLLQGACVSNNFFSMLGVKPVLGRVWSVEEDVPGKDNVALLSYDTWQTEFGGDRGVVGKIIQRTGTRENVTVIGVLPPDFQFVSEATQVWAPPGINTSAPTRFHDQFVFARLKPGVTIAQAQASMDSIATQLEKEFPRSNTGWGVTVQPIQRYYSNLNNARPTLLVLLAAVGALLLIACANVANLLLVRATARQQEIAVRAALGASRLRLVRQLLTESLLLGLLGGVAGFLLAWSGFSALVALAPRVPTFQPHALRVDIQVFIFSLLASLFVSILFGLIPAMRASRKGSNELLRAGRGVQGGLRDRAARSLLVMGEVALAVALMIASGLLVRSLRNLQTDPLGYSPDHLLMTGFCCLDMAHYPGQRDINAFYRQLSGRLQSLPGVESIASTTVLPLRSFDGGGTPILIQGRPVPAPGNEELSDFRVVGNAYFSTLKIPLLRGRDFTEQDDDEHAQVALINDAFRRRYFQDKEPLGQQVQIVNHVPFGRWFNVIGVVTDSRDRGLGKEIRPTIYLTVQQNDVRGTMMMVRTKADPMTMAANVRRTMLSVKSDLFIGRTSTMDDMLADSLSPQRFSVVLLSLFTGIAVGLALVGVYGVISYSVAQRTHEIGLRMALGAQPRDMLRLVIGQGLRLVLTGTAVGLAAAMAATQLMTNLLFGVSARDPLTAVLVCTAAVAVALMACYVPARRAMRVDPMIALRYE